MADSKATDDGIDELLQRTALACGDPVCGTLHGGGFGIEWHAYGMNIEIRFRSSDRIYHLIEDARGEVEKSEGFSRSVERVTAALAVFEERANAE